MTNTDSEARIIAILTIEAEKNQQVINEFSRKLVEQHAASTMEWADSAYRAAAMLEQILPFLNWAKKKESAGKLAERASRDIERIENHLLGDTFLGASEGPWRHSSSSASTNIMNIERANAMRSMRSILVSSLSRAGML